MTEGAPSSGDGWFSGLLFGTSTETAPVCAVAPGHRGIDVLIEDDRIHVDVDALAEVSGLFLQVQGSGDMECPLDDFPGGGANLKQILGVLTRNEELVVTDENAIQLFEAAWLLECPCLYDEVVGSSYMRLLSSRRKVAVLELLLPFTQESRPSESTNPVPACGRVQELVTPNSVGGLTPEGFVRSFALETKMWQRTERASIELCSQLDSGDLILSPRLAFGSLRVSCEILRLYRRRQEESGFVSSALNPVSQMWKNLTDKPLVNSVAWDEHHFALFCMRKRLEAEPRQEGDENWDKDIQDLPGDLCESVPDTVLLAISDLLEYVSVDRALPNWTALLIRMLLLRGRSDEARHFFAEAFARSHHVQALSWRKDAVVPAAWLSDVAMHAEACRALLRILGRYVEMDAADLCDLIEDVLLAKFLNTPHCASVLLVSKVVNDIVGACFDAARKTADFSGERCPEHWEGQHVLWRLHDVGKRLFRAAFVAQRGFLPHTWPDPLDPLDQAPEFWDGGVGACEEVHTQEPPPCSLAPLIIQVAGRCLWDEGLLKIELLTPVMDTGRASPAGPILHYGRQAIMRHLWSEELYCAIPHLKFLWELACWPLCEDPGLIREAFEYLKGVQRDLHSVGGSWSLEAQEALFQMFGALDVARLSGQALLSPWVPAQVYAVLLLVQQQPAEQLHAELQQEVVSTTESLRSVNRNCAKLTNRLNIVEQRTVINKSQIADVTMAIEEYKHMKELHGLDRAAGAR